MSDETLKFAEVMLEAHLRDLKKARESIDTKIVKHLAGTQLYHAACAYSKFVESEVHDFDQAMKFADALENAAIFFTHHQ